MSWQAALCGAYQPREIRSAGSTEHAGKRQDVPMIGPRGQLSYRNRTVYLSERNAMLAGVLVYYFHSAVTGVELLDRVWPEGATRRTLRRRLGRLDRRLARLGLRIVEAGDGKYTLCPDEGLRGYGAAVGSADEQYPHVGSVHEPVRDRPEY